MDMLTKLELEPFIFSNHLGPAYLVESPASRMLSLILTTYVHGTHNTQQNIA